MACAERVGLPRDPLQALDAVVSHSEQRLREIQEYRADYQVRSGDGPEFVARIYTTMVAPSAGYTGLGGEAQNAVQRLPARLPVPFMRLEVPSDNRVEIARAGSWVIYDSSNTPVHRSLERQTG